MALRLCSRLGPAPGSATGTLADEKDRDILRRQHPTSRSGEPMAPDLTEMIAHAAIGMMPGLIRTALLTPRRTTPWPTPARQGLTDRCRIQRGTIRIEASTD
jgi:hypothetical protein